MATESNDGRPAVLSLGLQSRLTGLTGLTGAFGGLALTFSPAPSPASGLGVLGSHPGAAHRGRSRSLPLAGGDVTQRREARWRRRRQEVRPAVDPLS